MSESTERWVPVVGYEGLYEVSDRARVRSLPGPHRQGCIRKLALKRNGYLFVALWRNNAEENAYIHRLVATAFCERGPDQPVVRHVDGNKLNNTPSNLAWGTFSENSYDTVRHGAHHSAGKSHCINGHEYTPQNTIQKATGRNCRTCTYDVTTRRKRELSATAGTLRDPSRCKNGHERTAENTYQYKGKRYCRACRRRNVSDYEKRKAA